MADAPHPSPRGGFFPDTRWSLISAIRGSGLEADQCAALDELCAAYWPAIYAYVRYQGRSPEDAEDLTQEFLSHILESELLNGTSSERGRLRTFIAVVLKRFLIDRQRHAMAKKRGGRQCHIPIDLAAGEEHLATLGDDHGGSPDDFFDRAFAASLMDRAVACVRNDYAAQDKLEVFETLKPSLLGGTDPGEVAEWAQRIGISPGTARVAAHRLRKRFRQAFREVVLETVEDPADLDEELAALLEASQ